MIFFHSYRRFAFCILLFLSYSCSAQTVSDNKIDKYLEKPTVDNKNAFYINGSDIYGSGTVYVGYQRDLVKDFWAEAGIGFGIRTIKTFSINNSSLIIQTPLRLILNEKEIEESFRGNLDEGNFFSLKPNLAFEFGLYKRIFGQPVSSQLGIGIHTKLASYDMDYIYSYRNSDLEDISINAKNKLSRTSIYASLIYKMQLSNHFGIDYTAGIGPSIMNFKNSTTALDFFNERKHTIFDYYLSLKFYYTF